MDAEEKDRIILSPGSSDEQALRPGFLQSRRLSPQMQPRLDSAFPNDNPRSLTLASNVCTFTLVGNKGSQTLNSFNPVA